MGKSIRSASDFFHVILFKWLESIHIELVFESCGLLKGGSSLKGEARRFLANSVRPTSCKCPLKCHLVPLLASRNAITNSAHMLWLRLFFYLMLQLAKTQ
jgi:hypothetical protein